MVTSTITFRGIYIYIYIYIFHVPGVQIPRYPTNAHEALQNQAGEWKLLHLESKHIVKIRSWDSTDSSEPSALCARLEITALRPGGVPEVFSFPSKCVNNPSFEYPAEGTLQDSQIVDLQFDGKGSCLDVTVAPNPQASLKGLNSLFVSPSATGTLHGKGSLEQFLLETLLPHWEKEWKKLWPKPAKKDLLEWSDGNSMKGLVEAAKFFVLKAIAEGSPATPQTIFALHVHTLSSRIPRDCQRALSSKDSPLRHLWAPYAQHISTALKACPLYWGYVFRTETFLCDGEAPCVAEYLRQHRINVGSEISWPGFASGTSSSQVARNLLLGHDIGERPDKNAGIVFKIIEARAVSVAPFSKFPEEAEVIFEPGSKFEVKGFYKLTDFILEDGGSALDWQEWKVSFDVIKQPQLKLEAAGKERDLVVLLQQVPAEVGLIDRELSDLVLLAQTPPFSCLCRVFHPKSVLYFRFLTWYFRRFFGFCWFHGPFNRLFSLPP